VTEMVSKTTVNAGRHTHTCSARGTTGCFSMTGNK